MPIIDCLAVAEKKRLECDLTERACLHIIQIGDNPVNELYLKSKIAEAEKWNVEVVVDRFKGKEDLDEIIALMSKLNQDDKVDGMIMQLPTNLPKNLEDHLTTHIYFEKDVDGLNPLTRSAPCTPLGIMWLLEDIGYEGKTISVIGRGKLVGKPLIDILRNKPCTLILMNSSTDELQRYDLMNESDIVITAVGIPSMFGGWTFSDMKKTYVIDAGISRVNGKQVGDFSHENLDSIYGDYIHYTQWVGNSVGKLTVASLMYNVRKAHDMKTLK